MVSKTENHRQDFCKYDQLQTKEVKSEFMLCYVS